MKRSMIFASLAWAAASAMAQSNAGISIGIQQPGVYGRIDFGNLPPPAVIYPQPVLVVPQPVVVNQQPIYLYVPPGHQKKWSKHCARYGACGQPVYFVQERWVRERYEEQRRGEPDEFHGKKDKKDKKEKKHKGKHDDD